MLGETRHMQSNSEEDVDACRFSRVFRINGSSIVGLSLATCEKQAGPTVLQLPAFPWPLSRMLLDPTNGASPHEVRNGVNVCSPEVLMRAGLLLKAEPWQSATAHVAERIVPVGT